MNDILCSFTRLKDFIIGTRITVYIHLLLVYIFVICLFIPYILYIFYYGMFIHSIINKKYKGQHRYLPESSGVYTPLFKYASRWLYFRKCLKSASVPLLIFQKTIPIGAQFAYMFFPNFLNRRVLQFFIISSFKVTKWNMYLKLFNNITVRYKVFYY